jgi:hypothetical protein
VSKLINPTEVNIPIVDSDGKPTQAFYQLINDLSELEILSGEGSPEGVLKAKRKAQYYDISGAVGSILYIKTTDSNIDTGWVLV